ncbi:MAG: DMT family transporter [Pseudomonadota bacterium]
MPAFANIVTWLYARPALLLSLTALFWAGNTTAGQLAKGEITPMQVVLLRWIVVACLLWPIFGREVRAHWHVAKPRLTLIIIMSVIGFTGFNALFYVASLYTTAVNVGILQGAMPTFVMAGAFIAYGTRISLLQAVGVVVTLVGVVIVATRGAPQLLLETVLNRGDLLMLLAGTLYAAYAVLLQKRPDIPGAPFFTLMSVIAMVTAIPPVIIEVVIDGGVRLPTWNGLGVMLYIALFPSCLAQLFFLRGVDLIGPGRAGVYINLVPVLAAILAVLLLGEKFAGYHAVALVLVLGGIALAQRKPG